MISIIIPCYNEYGTIGSLIQHIGQVIGSMKLPAEIILVNDGSTDVGAAQLKKEVSKKMNGKVSIITHRKRMGKGRALSSGIEASSGDIIVFMDADWQDDPRDLPRFLALIRNGYDFVNGWRVVRKDGLSKTVPSSLLNFFLTRITGSPFHDINCGFKAMRRQVLDEIPLYGDNYRFLPILAHRLGFKTTETPVLHHARRNGKSKYGILRILSGFFDMLNHLFLLQFIEKPIHFFGSVGGFIFIIGLIILVLLGVQRLFYGQLLYRRPILFVGLLFVIVGVQIVMTGFIGELVVYLNKKKRGKYR